MRSSSSLYVSSPYQLLNQLLGFYKIQQEGRAFEGDLDAIIFNSVSSTVPK
jgi:hypothetical protein